MIDKYWRGISIAAQKSRNEYRRAMVAPSLSKRGVVGHLAFCMLLVNLVRIGHPAFMWQSVVYLACVTPFVFVEKTRKVALHIFNVSVSLYLLLFFFWALSVLKCPVFLMFDGGPTSISSGDGCDDRILTLQRPSFFHSSPPPTGSYG